MNESFELFARNGDSSNRYTINNSPIILGIPLDTDYALELIKYTGTKNHDKINKYLEGKNSPIRLEIIDGAHGLGILGYYITNVSHINGPLKKTSDLLKELLDKTLSFKKHIKELIPELEKITLFLHEADPDQIEVNIDNLEPYLFELKAI